MTSVLGRLPGLNVSETSSTENEQFYQAASASPKPRFSISRGVRFAHAHAAHRFADTKSANTRRLLGALAKGSPGNGSKTRFADTTRKPAGNAKQQVNRDTEKRRQITQRQRDERGGRGRQEQGQKQSQKQQEKQERHGHQHPEDDALHPDAANFVHPGHKTGRIDISKLSLFPRDAFLLEGSMRAAALAKAWCAAVLTQDNHQQGTARQHDAMRQLRMLRQHEGKLPFNTLAAVREALIDGATLQAEQRSREATRHAAAEDAIATARRATTNLLAPLRVLSAGRPMLARSEARASNVNTCLARTARARSDMQPKRDDGDNGEVNTLA